MIHATQYKPVQAKAPKSVEARPVTEKAGSKSNELEKGEFAQELETSMGEESSPQKTEAASVEKSEESKTVIGSENTKVTPEASASQILFDPAVTESVELAISPLTVEGKTEVPEAEILKLLKGEVPAEMNTELLTELKAELKADPKAEVSNLLSKLSAPQTIESEKAVATDGSVEAKLMNMEDFVAQKNAAKKSSSVVAYGIGKNQNQKVISENGLKSTQVVKETSALEGNSSGPVNSQQFILNMMNEQKSSPQVNDVQAAPKVFDMSQIKSSSADQIMTQISDYMIQTKASKEPTVTMRMNHEDLGIIDITVQKAIAGTAADAVAINIGAHSVEGKNFFQQNSKELLSHMSSAGISVTDFKVETPNQSGKSDFDFNGQNSGKQSGSEKHFGSEQNQRKHESDRRQDLWKLLNKEAA